MHALFSLTYPQRGSLDREVWRGIQSWIAHTQAAHEIGFHVKLEAAGKATVMTAYSSISPGRRVEAAWYVLGWLARAGYDISTPE